MPLLVSSTTGANGDGLGAILALTAGNASASSAITAAPLIRAVSPSIRARRWRSGVPRRRKVAAGFRQSFTSFLGRLNNVVNGPRPSAGCMPRISHDVKAENRGKSGQEQSLIDLRQRKAVVP